MRDIYEEYEELLKENMNLRNALQDILDVQGGTRWSDAFDIARAAIKKEI